MWTAVNIRLLRMEIQYYLDVVLDMADAMAVADLPTCDAESYSVLEKEELQWTSRGQNTITGGCH